MSKVWLITGAGLASAKSTRIQPRSVLPDHTVMTKSRGSPSLAYHCPPTFRATKEG
jgi:hypothetical protein